jgi:succinoglycan biosynthesis protein ExoA
MARLAGKPSDAEDRQDEIRMSESKPLPPITIVIAARNEERYIRRCLEHIMQAQYPHELMEILVVDGMSEDHTADVVRDLAAKFPNIRLLSNPRRVAPVAFNLGIEAAKGDIVFFLSAHSAPSGAAGYFKQCVQILLDHPEVWCAGGADHTVGEGFVGRTIAAAMTSPVGAGNARYRLGRYKGYVDTVTGCYWRWVFDKIGPFDEELVRNQDDELNFRVIQGGGKIYLDSDIPYGYHARNTFRGFFRQYYQYGFWRIRTIQKHHQPASMRQVAPLGFVLAWLVLILGTIAWWPIDLALAALAGCYGLALLYGTVDVARREGVKYALLAPLSFAIMHFGYGLGGVAGIVNFVVLRRGKSATASSRGARQVAAPDSGTAMGGPKTGEAGPTPMISVIVPARNENAYIESCLRHILASDYPKDRLEVLVVDGLSEDGTAETVRRLAAEDSRVHLVPNPRRITPVAFNLGIEAARGDILFIVSAHGRGAPDYFRRCVRILQEHPEVWCAGGAIRTLGEGYTGQVIAAAMSHAVGAGNARFRLGHYEGYVGTVTSGGYWRWVFDKIGLFDEELIRNQDDDLNFRLRQAGGKIYLDGNLEYDYHSRDSLAMLARQYFQYGFWRIRTLQKHKRPAMLRQVAPLGFVLIWIALVIGTVLWQPEGYALAGFAGLYLLALLYGAVGVARKAGLRYAPLAPVAFALMHFSYGIGGLMGVWTFIILRRGGTICEVKYPMSR